MFQHMFKSKTKYNKQTKTIPTILFYFHFVERFQVNGHKFAAEVCIIAVLCAGTYPNFKCEQEPLAAIVAVLTDKYKRLFVQHTTFTASYHWFYAFKTNQQKYFHFKYLVVLVSVGIHINKNE